MALLVALALLAAPVSLPESRDGSGTSWMPDASPISAHHFMSDGWMAMVHYDLKAGYDDQWSDRGSRRFTSTNWLMGMASHAFLGGELSLRAMLSLEPATAGGEKQIPLLLQSGETYAGVPLHDRQHPHDLFMELAARVRYPIGDYGLELYGGPAAEPALGPTAFMHRVPAMSNPFPPIGHHWQDSTHISFGVVTAGVYNRWLKLEGSIFNGREPDEDRWNFDFAPLDSWSARLSANPTRETSLQVSWGFLKGPELLEPEASAHRLTASVTYDAPWRRRGNLAVTALWGRNLDPAQASDSALLEGSLDLDGKSVPFARIEYVQKLGHDLVLPGDPAAKYDVFQGSVGFLYRFTGGPIVPVVGAAVDLGLVPESIEAAYGTRVPVGAFVFVGLQPPRMRMAGQHQMHPMHGM